MLITYTYTHTHTTKSLLSFLVWIMMKERRSKRSLQVMRGDIWQASLPSHVVSVGLGTDNTGRFVTGDIWQPSLPVTWYQWV